LQKILVVAAHPDDELLGGAGTFRKHVLAGDEVYCLILGEGAVMHGISSNDLQKQSREAGEIIGFKEMYFHGFPDNRLDTMALMDVIKIVERHIQLIQPDILFVHHFGDLNIDHRIAYQVCITVARPGCSSVREIYAYETPSSTEWTFDGSFKPNVFVEIKEEVIIEKVVAFGCYLTEVRDFPHPRSKQGLYTRAMYWGQISGTKYAEAFELIRKIS
jgi:LmbE family N-acetylglucosaminyl deacetylase